MIQLSFGIFVRCRSFILVVLQVLWTIPVFSREIIMYTLFEEDTHLTTYLCTSQSPTRIEISMKALYRFL